MQNIEYLKKDDLYMQQALLQAQHAFDRNEVPIGAVIVDKDGNFKKTISVFSGKSKITIKSVNNFNKTAVIERNIEVK